MKISLFQGIFIGVFGLAALIGVFVFATHSGSGSSNSNSTAIGTVVIWGTLPKVPMQNVLTALTQSNPSLKDVSYVQKSQDTLASDLAAAIATASAPDLVIASQEELQPISKLITPISPSVLPVPTFTSTFVEGGNLFLAPLGAGYYGIPFLVDPLVLYSNHAILSSDNIARPPSTWESLTGLVPNVAILTPTKQITRGLIALGTYGNIHNARGILSSLFLQTGVPMSVYKDGALSARLSGTSVGSDSSPGQAVLNFYTQFADPSKVSYTWNASLPDSQQAFLAGDLALYIGYVSEAPFITAANPNLNFSVTQIPQPATAQVKNTYGRIYASMIPRGAKNASGAYQVAVLLTSIASQAVAAPGLSLAPATLTSLAQAPADSISAVAYAEALYTNGWLSPSTADTDAVLSSMITSVISGRLTPNNALTSGEAALTSLLQQ